MAGGKKERRILALTGAVAVAAVALNLLLTAINNHRNKNNKRKGLMMGRSPCCNESGFKKGPWTPEEDERLIDHINRHGHGSAGEYIQKYSYIKLQFLDGAVMNISTSIVVELVEAKLRQLLTKLGSQNKILGIQVCAYKDGKVVIETSAGVIGEDDPRPVQHDTLFNVFSATKAVAAGMVHWLVDKGVIQLDQSVADIWPGFRVCSYQ